MMSWWRGLLAGAMALIGAEAGAGPAHAAWQEASSKHFVVYSDDAPDKVRAFTVRLERFDKAMRVLRNLDDPAISPTQRVTVFVLDDTRGIEKLYGRGGDGVAGFYNPRAAGPVAFVPRRGDGGGKQALTPEQILFHEYAHHLMFTTMGGMFVPPWYVEGFAEYSATAKLEDDGGVMFGAVPMYRLYGIAEVSPMPARRLLVADPAQLSDEGVETMYGRGWLLTHYLTMDAGRRRQLADYLNAVNAGATPQAAGEKLGLSTLDDRLAAYIRERLKGFALPASRLPIGEVAVRPLGPGEAAVMPARILSARGVDPKGAARTVALARKLAAPFPHDAAAQNELAEAEFDAGEGQASLAAAERALAADPQSLHATIYRGLATQLLALKAKATDPAAFKPSRAAFVAANHLDHDAPWPLELNYLSYIVAGQKPTANAEEGLLTAATLAPYDDDLLLLAAQVLLARGKPADARTYLSPIASNPHGGGATAFAHKLLALIDKGDAAGALALYGAGGGTAAKRE